VVLTAADYDGALHFYRDVLGLREQAAFVDDNGGRATLLQAGRATIEIGDEAHAEAIDEVEVGRRVAGAVRLAFEVTDPVTTTDELAAAGATVVAPPVRTPWDGQQLTLFAGDDA
jgi:catechol 2,3-dioxygenase-like lactoylglutathione lyase family enzyme